MKRITQIALAFSLFTIVAAPLALAQTTAPSPDQSSLGDYARKVHKDPAVKVKPKVYDNDNLPKDDKLSVVGDAGATANAAATTENKEAENKSADDETSKKQSEWKGWQDKISSQKNAIDLASRELDVVQKEYQLRAAAMYADVGNRMRNAAQWDKEDADYKQKIADKQKAVDDAKQKLDEMQEEARKAGVPAAIREP